MREEVFVQYLYGSFREEVLKFQGRCFEELLTKKIDDVVRGEVVKFEGGGICPISVFGPYFILWKNQRRVALDLHKKQCRDKGELRPIFIFFHFQIVGMTNCVILRVGRPDRGLLEAQRATCGSLLGVC